jgi:hypothetical protein
VFDLCVTLTDQNRREILALSPTIPVTHCLTNGVDLSYFSYDPSPDEPAGVCFVGRMDYAANTDAVSYFYHEIFPLLRASRSDIRFLIVGSSPTPEVRQLANDPAVEVTAHVPDVRPFLRRAGIAVIPTRIGGGILNKILEALAMGVPVVSNTRSIEGLRVIPGEHLLVADSPEDFARCILRLFHDPSLRSRLAANGRQYVESNHRWETIIRRYEEVIRERLRSVERHTHDSGSSASLD